MLGRAHVLMKGPELVRQSDDIVSVVSRRGSRPGNGSRIGWIIAGIVAVAVTLTVVVREVLNRTEDPDVERTGEEAAEPTLLPARESM
jgi:hypothetical protein